MKKPRSPGCPADPDRPGQPAHQHAESHPRTTHLRGRERPDQHLRGQRRRPLPPRPPGPLSASLPPARLNKLMVRRRLRLERCGEHPQRSHPAPTRRIPDSRPRGSRWTVVAICSRDRTAETRLKPSATPSLCLFSGALADVPDVDHSRAPCVVQVVHPRTEHAGDA